MKPLTFIWRVLRTFIPFRHNPYLGLLLLALVVGLSVTFTGCVAASTYHHLQNRHPLDTSNAERGWTTNR